MRSGAAATKGPAAATPLERAAEMYCRAAVVALQCRRDFRRRGDDRDAVIASVADRWERDCLRLWLAEWHMERVTLADIGAAVLGLARRLGVGEGRDGRPRPHRVPGHPPECPGAQPRTEGES